MWCNPVGVQIASSTWHWQSKQTLSSPDTIPQGEFAEQDRVAGSGDVQKQGKKCVRALADGFFLCVQ